MEGGEGFGGELREGYELGTRDFGFEGRFGVMNEMSESSELGPSHQVSHKQLRLACGFSDKVM